MKDTGGPYAGIYYTRSTSGSTWSTPKRINPTSSHAIRFGIAAAGTRVYVAYVTQTRVYRYSPTAPRVLYVRTNTSHGSTTSWRPAIRLTSLSSRVDYPTIAATGDDVHVAWTNSNTGDVFVATSRDRGVTWTTRKVGSTTQSSTSGKAGLPSIAASGATVAVAWKSDRNTLRTRVSTDLGSHWGTPLETFNVRDTFSVAARVSRVAVAFWGYDGLQVMTRVNGSWGPARVVQDPGDFLGYSVSVALQDADRVGVAYSMEMGAETWAELWWTESTDNGVNWYLPQTVASSGSSLRRTNDWPTVIWPTAGTRFVSWSGWTVDTSNYRMYLRKGSGTAASLTFLAPAAEPGAGVAATPPDAGGTRRDSIERH